VHVLPQLRELESRFPTGLAVVGVHSGKYVAERETPRIRDASIRLGATHPIVNDRQFRLWRAYAVRAWPTLVAIDPRGYVVGMQAGEFTADALAPFIERTLAQAREAGTLAQAEGAGGPPHRGVYQSASGAPSPLHAASHRPALQPPADRFTGAFADPTDAPTHQPGTLAFPGKVAVRGSRIAIADSAHHRILVGTLGDAGTTMRVHHSLGGTPGWRDGAGPLWNNPQGLAFGGDVLYVADAGNHCIRAVRLADGETRTLAGIGRPLRGAVDEAKGALSSPWDLAVDGDRLMVAMAGIHQLWTVSLVTGAAEAFSGSGAEELHDARHADAAFAQPMSVLAAGGQLFFTDAESSAVRVAGREASGAVRTLVGTGLFDFGDADGTGDDVRLQHPQGIARAADGRLLVCDSYNDALKWLDPASRRVETWVRGLSEPGGVAIGESHAYVADTNAHRIAVVSLATGEVATLAIELSPQG
jgi:hypothetical protein